MSQWTWYQGRPSPATVNVMKAVVGLGDFWMIGLTLVYCYIFIWLKGFDYYLILIQLVLWKIYQESCKFLLYLSISQNLAAFTSLPIVCCNPTFKLCNCCLQYCTCIMFFVKECAVLLNLFTWCYCAMVQVTLLTNLVGMLTVSCSAVGGVSCLGCHPRHVFVVGDNGGATGNLLARFCFCQL